MKALTLRQTNEKQLTKKLNIIEKCLTVAKGTDKQRLNKSYANVLSDIIANKVFKLEVNRPLNKTLI